MPILSWRRPDDYTPSKPTFELTGPQVRARVATKAMRRAARPAAQTEGLEESDFRVYQRRNWVLSRMGFTSYSEYLESDLWKRIRRLVLKKHPVCYGCGGSATSVHHCSYSKAVLKGKKRKRLLSVCAECHRRAEYDSGRKVGLHEANRRLKAIRRGETI